MLKSRASQKKKKKESVEKAENRAKCVWSQLTAESAITVCALSLLSHL